MQKMKLVQELEPYREQLEKTVRPYINIVSKKAGELGLFSSKAGAYLYLPEDEKYPQDLDNHGNRYYQYPLLQINCAEVPEFGDFPKEGILVFYVNEMMDKYTVKYYPVIEESAAKINTTGPFPKLEDIWRLNPFKEPTAIFFEKKWAPVSPTDYECAKLLPEQLVDDSFIALYHLACEDSNKIGGYANPNQWDARNKENNKEYSTLLLQIQNDNFMINFFIKPEDLKNKNFNDILFDASCD